MTIATILARKGDEVFCVRPDDDAMSIARTLACHRVGAVLVQNGDGIVLGIVSERDIVRAMARPGTDVARLRADSLMTRDLAVVSCSTPIVAALALMTERRIRHLPVMEDGRLIGLVSIGDLVKARIGMVELEAEALKTYVHS